MPDKTVTIIFLFFVFFCMFTFGRYYQIGYIQTHPESEICNNVKGE